MRPVAALISGRPVVVVDRLPTLPRPAIGPGDVDESLRDRHAAAGAWLISRFESYRQCFPHRLAQSYMKPELGLRIRPPQKSLPTSRGRVQCRQPELRAIVAVRMACLRTPYAESKEYRQYARKPAPKTESERNNCYPGYFRQQVGNVAH